MPISRFVAVSFRPASSVLRRTLARTGSVEGVETARLTTDRPRARFSCMTESFTSGTPAQRGSPLGRVAARSAVRSIAARGSVSLCSYLPPIFSPRHHRRNGVDDVDAPEWLSAATAWTTLRESWTTRSARGCDGGPTVHGPPRTEMSVVDFGESSTRLDVFYPPPGARFHSRGVFSTDPGVLSTTG